MVHFTINTIQIKYKYLFINNRFFLDCAQTWANLKTSCYKLFHNNNTNQQKAETVCVREGGHLVSINSEEEMAFVHRLLFTMAETTSADKIYIGMLILFNLIYRFSSGP